jgi:multiple sugar transport system substrate-binding protein
MIPKGSRNKLAAWEYIKHSQAAEAPYRDSLEAKRWYSKLRPTWVTPLDKKAAELWDKEMQEIWQHKDKPSQEYLQMVEDKLRSTLGKELNTMFEVLK